MKGFALLEVAFWYLYSLTTNKNGLLMQSDIHHEVQIRLKPIYLNFIFMLYYEQWIKQVCFSSISMDSDYHNAVFVYVYGQQKLLKFCCFCPDLCSLLCHVLFCGEDTNTLSSCLWQFNALR